MNDNVETDLTKLLKEVFNAVQNNDMETANECLDELVERIQSGDALPDLRKALLEN